MTNQPVSLNDSAYDAALEAVYQYRSNTPVDNYTLKDEYAVFLETYKQADTNVGQVSQVSDTSSTLSGYTKEQSVVFDWAAGHGFTPVTSEINDLLIALQQREISVIMTPHLKEDARGLADQIISSLPAGMTFCEADHEEAASYAESDLSDYYKAGWKAAIAPKRESGEVKYIEEMLEKHADRADMFQPETEVIETRWVKLMMAPEQECPITKEEFSAMLMREYGYSKKLSDSIANDASGYGAFDPTIIEGQ